MFNIMKFNKSYWLILREQCETTIIGFQIKGSDKWIHLFLGNFQHLVLRCLWSWYGNEYTAYNYTIYNYYTTVLFFLLVSNIILNTFCESFTLFRNYVAVFCNGYCKLVYNEGLNFFSTKLIFLCSKDALNWLKATLNAFIMVQKICISNKYHSFELFIDQCIIVSTKIMLCFFPKNAS